MEVVAMLSPPTGSLDLMMVRAPLQTVVRSAKTLDQPVVKRGSASSPSTSAAKFAVSGQGERLPLPKTIVYRVVNGAYGRVCVASTQEGRPCALLLDPTAKRDQHGFLNDLRSRFPKSCTFVHETEAPGADIGGANGKATDSLDELVRFCDEQSGAAAAATKQSYDALARALQARTLLYGSAFQHSVWRAMMSVDVGQTISYAQLAQRAGRDTKAVRAVAQACGTNPLTLLFPCHRIVSSSGTMGGYHWGVETKQAILRDEGRIRNQATNGSRKTMKLIRAV